MPATTRRQLQLARAKAQKEECQQKLLVHMHSDEFLDYCLRAQMRRGLTREQVVAWIDKTLAQAGITSANWAKHRDDIKNFSSYTAVGLDVAALYAIAKEMVRGGNLFSKFKIKETSGKTYVIFEGYKNLRKDLKGSRYLASNPKVVSFGIGKEGIKHVVKQGFIVSIFISAGFHAVDQLLDDKKTWHHFVAGMAVDIALAATASGIAWGVATAMTGAAAMVAVGPLLILVIAGSLATFILAKTIDSKSLTTQLADWLIEIDDHLSIQLEKSQRHIERIEKDYTADPQSFLYRLFGIPQKVL